MLQTVLLNIFIVPSTLRYYYLSTLCGDGATVENVASVRAAVDILGFMGSLVTNAPTASEVNILLDLRKIPRHASKRLGLGSLFAHFRRWTTIYSCLLWMIWAAGNVTGRVPKKAQIGHGLVGYHSERLLLSPVNETSHHVKIDAVSDTVYRGRLLGMLCLLFFKACSHAHITEDKINKE